MFSAALLKQDYKINRKRILGIYVLQLLSLLVAVGICEMNLIQVSDIFWDTLPVFVIPLAMQMLLAYQAVQKRVEDGTVDFILATQISREKMLTTKIIYMILNTALLFGVSALIGCASSVYRLPGTWSRETYLLLNLGGFCMQIFWGGFCFMVSCRAARRSVYLKLAVGIPILQYLLYLGYYLVPQLSFLKYLTIFSLCQHVMFAKKSALLWVASAICFVLGIVFFLAGRYLFQKRDYVNR